MNEQLAGNFILVKGSPDKDKYLSARAAFARQAALRGDEKPYTFKAQGCTWRYEPVGEVKKR